MHIISSKRSELKAYIQGVQQIKGCGPSAKNAISAEELRQTSLRAFVSQEKQNNTDFGQMS